MKIGLVVGGTDRFILPVIPRLIQEHEFVRFLPGYNHWPFNGNTFQISYLKQELSKFISSNDVTLFEWATELLEYAANLQKAKPIIARLHSFELTTYASKINWPAVDRLIVLNNTMHISLLKKFGNSLPPITVIPNGVNLDRFRPCKRKFAYRIGMVCSVSSRKRVYDMLICIHTLRQAGHPFTLRVAGPYKDDDPAMYKWAIDCFVDKFSLCNFVQFEGDIVDVPNFLENTDVFISNSYAEGQQIGLLEAMASGCYCLGHCWPGIEDILPKENVYMAESELCQKLIEYANCPEPERVIRQTAMRQIVEARHNEEHMAYAMVDSLKGVASRP